MWILSCESECLGGKRTWLRPGSESLLGRTSSKTTDGKLQLHIDHKSVSRTHLILKVSEIKSGDATQLLQHEHMELEDTSKTGTLINGEKIVKTTRALSPGDYTIRLGHYEPSFHLTWQPIVLSVTNVNKTDKKSGDALGALREKLEQAGVKLSMEYINGKTTHVIAKKRNTAMGLQALTQANWLVTESFADALSRACQREAGTDGQGRALTSALEQDFDAGWPREEAFIVPAGREPVQCPNDQLKPQPERSSVFENFTFVFLSEVQYTMLLPVVTTGHGKAALYQYHPDQTTVLDVVDFVADLAGHKGEDGFQLRQQASPGGFVIVRIGENDLGRSSSFMRDLDLALDQRSMEQSEFFGAIIDNNAVSLRQPLRDESEDAAQSPRDPVQPPILAGRGLAEASDSPAVTNHSPPQIQQPVPGPVSEQDASPAKKRPRRLFTKSRFQGFDDFDPSQIVRDDSDSQESPSQAMGQSQGARDDEAKSRADEPSASTNIRKRRASEEARDEDKAFLDEILPGVAALKRRRTEALKNGLRDVFAQPSKDSTIGMSENSLKSKPKKSFLDKDIKAEIKKRREREDEERRKDEEALQKPLDVDLTELRDLAKVEIFQLPVRGSRPSCTNGLHGENWDPAWNGRKNFKKFRPRGQRLSDHAAPKVYVSLEEVPGRDRGLGNICSLENNTTPSRSKSKSQSQSQPHVSDGGGAAPEIANGDEDDSLAFRRRSQQRNGARLEAASTATEEQAPAGTNSQTLGINSQRNAAGKRPAVQQPPGEPINKRSRNAAIRKMTTLDDDDDPLAFRRRKR